MGFFIIYDLCRGLLGRWKRLLAAAVFCIVAMVYLQFQARGLAAASQEAADISAADCLLHMVHGMEPVVLNEQKRFELPVSYLGVMVANAFLLMGFLHEEMHGFGVQIFIRDGQRHRWMAGKILWNVLAVTSVYVMIVLFSWIAGGGGFRPNAVLCEKILMFRNVIDFEGTDIELFLAALGMAYLSSLAFGQLQMTLELIFSPAAAFFAVIAAAFMSVYYVSPLLLGNCFMFQRNAIFLEGGIKTGTGMAVAAAWIALCVALDFYYIKRRDIL